MASPTLLSVDFNTRLGEVATQFKDLDPKRPGMWPWLPRLAVFAAVAAAAILVGYFVFISGAKDELAAAEAKEPQLQADYRSRYAQAVNLEALKKQKVQVEEYVTQLEKQLPGKAEMDALLSDINQAGIGRGLQFQLFRPGQVEVKDYYAELPISVKVSGRYHDMGAFAADIANLSRIVTLHNVSVTLPQGSPKDRDASTLQMEATARTYRYLDADEVQSVKASQGKKKGATQ